MSKVLVPVGACCTESLSACTQVSQTLQYHVLLFICTQDRTYTSGSNAAAAAYLGCAKLLGARMLIARGV